MLSELKKERPPLIEAGVTYTHNLETARALGFARMFYRWSHTNGAAGTSAIFCNPGDLPRLLNRWNEQKSKFKYWQ